MQWNQNVVERHGLINGLVIQNGGELYTRCGAFRWSEQIIKGANFILNDNCYFINYTKQCAEYAKHQL